MVLIVLALVIGAVPALTVRASADVTPLAQAQAKIKHVIFITQENRSFDNYFGTYPGADGIPMVNGVPTVCVPDPLHRTCIKPFKSTRDVSVGGPHGALDAAADIDRGKMDGFIKQAEISLLCTNPAPRCNGEALVDSMAYYDGKSIPNYWKYATYEVLADHFFEPIDSWSLPSHLWQLSAWSALCTSSSDPFSCKNDIALGNSFTSDLPRNHNFAWTDITYLLYKHSVSWKYYVVPGYQPDCDDSHAMSCSPIDQNSKTPGIWNPLPEFTDVKQDGQLGNIQPIDNYYQDAQAGTLPAVSWVVPSRGVSEHPGGQIKQGMAYVTSLINAVMRGPDWDSTAIFLSWDDWGGFYDHVHPPKYDENSYGIRVPMLLISPWARIGYIDHRTLSDDSFLKFIEDLYMGGSRLDPATDGRPDPRPDVREAASWTNDLLPEFNFNYTSPRPPWPQPLYPKTDLVG